MAPVVFKPMAAIASSGYEVDVVCADSFCRELLLDNSLLPYAERFFPNIFRLNPDKGLMGWIKTNSRILSRTPDLMTVLHRAAYEYLMEIDLDQYDAVMTWSPFHSVNPVMAKVKKARSNVRWIAQFSDPWAGNPLETGWLTNTWNAYHEPQTVKSADHIIHSSAYSLELMLKGHPDHLRKKFSVLPHVFNTELYPQRPKEKNEKIVMRYVGVLYGRRSPEPLFQALNCLFDRRKDLTDRVSIELVGQLQQEMLLTNAAKALPPGCVRVVPNVDYLKSLELMYDADILLLIEADIRQNLFLASKVSDYFGANARIVGLVPPGASEDALSGLGCWYAKPSDVSGIADCLEHAISHAIENDGSPWCNEEFRLTFGSGYVAKRYLEILNGLRT